MYPKSPRPRALASVVINKLDPMMSEPVITPKVIRLLAASVTDARWLNPSWLSCIFNWPLRSMRNTDWMSLGMVWPRRIAAAQPVLGLQHDLRGRVAIGDDTFHKWLHDRDHVEPRIQGMPDVLDGRQGL